MIKELIIKDFENHEKTKLEFDNGFNLVSGLSNVGKSSVVRAIRLLAYNKFDPKSVRIGKSNCDITAITDKGTVRVIRGKKNTWYVTPNGEETKEFHKIGKKPLPDACEILGLNVVQLGDTDIEVNIMEQLEGHFMMSEIGGKSVAGSVRAQIVDEISGLTGIEGLIRDVAKDNLHSQKSIKSLEQSIEDNQKDLEDETILEDYENKLFVLEETIEEHREMVTLKSDINSFQLDYQNNNLSLNSKSKELNSIPDTEVISFTLNEMESYISAINSGENLVKDYNSELKNITNTEDALKSIGSKETESINNSLIGLEDKIEKLDKGLDIYDNFHNTDELINDCNRQINYHSGINIDIVSIDGDINKINSLRNILLNFENNNIELNSLVSEKNELNDSLVELKELEKEILSSIKICPLTLNAIGSGCGL